MTSKIALSIALGAACCWSSLSEAVTRPPAPVAISPKTTVTTASPRFKWSAVNANYYRLVVKTAAGLPVVDVTRSAATVRSTIATQCWLVCPKSLPSGNYSWQVRGKNAAGNGPWSTLQPFTIIIIPGKPVPETPTGAIGSGTPDFKWSPVQADSYNLVVKNADDAEVVNVSRSKTVVLPTGATKCVLHCPKTLAPGTYKWQVRGKNAAGFGPWSVVKWFTVLAIPQAPVLVSPLSSTGTAAPAYQWNAVANAAKYELLVFNGTSNLVNQTYTAVQVGTTGTCAITPPTSLPNAVYSWRVRALNAAAVAGPWSTTATFEVLVGWDEITIPGNDPRIQLVTPAVAELIDLTNGKSYEFAWTSNGIYYETPWCFYLVGHPANLATMQNVFQYNLSTNDAEITHFGGIINVTAADIAATGVTTDNGFYQWVVAGWYGAHPDSRTFRVKK